MRRNQRKRNKEKTNNKKNIITYTIIILLIIIFIAIIKTKPTLNISKTNEEKEEYTAENLTEQRNNQNQEKTKKTEETTTFTLTALGDTLCHNTQYWDAYQAETDTYDFNYVYEDITRYTKTSDIVVGSLETTFAGKERGYSNYPTFNSPDELATALKKIGVSVITLAGNHALDYGYTGLSRTIDVFDEIDISHIGTYKTQEDQEKILVKNVKGVKIAFINYTYGTNGIPVPTGKEYCINLINKDLIKKQINQAKEQNVDMIVACMHWGIEYKTTPSDEQKELANYLFENGVDVIIGNHPHVIEPMEKREITLEDGSKKECFVVYALGNLTADQREEITKDSAILTLNITKEANKKIKINKAEYVPIYMYKNPNVKLHKFKILDIRKTIEAYETGENTNIGQATYNNLKTQLNKITSILGENIN